MKILLITSILPPEIGGPASYTSELAAKLTADNTVTIITFTKNPKKIRGVKIISIPQYSIKLIGSLLRQAHLFLACSYYCRNIDLIYAQDALVVGLSSVISGKIHNSTTLTKFVGDIPWETARSAKGTNFSLEEFYIQKPSLKYRLLALLQRFTLKLTTQVITPSQYLKSFLASMHKIPSQQITVIPNPVEIKSSKTVKRSNSIIWQGRMVPWKHVDQIIQAFKHAQHQNSSLSLTLVGDGPEMQTLQDLVNKLNLSKSVTFAGQLSKKDALATLQSHEKIVLYSSYEGQSHTLIEAMLSHCQIVASNITPNQELVSKFGILVPLNNIDQFSKAILKPVNPIILSQAFTYASKHHTWKNHLNSLKRTTKKNVRL